MRKELDDLLAWIGQTNEWALSVFYDHVERPIEPLREA